MAGGIGGSEVSPDIKAFVARDRLGGSAPWQHCNLCPCADDAPCVRSCTTVRETAAREDRITVTHQ